MKQAFLIEPIEGSEDDDPGTPTLDDQAEISVYALADVLGPRTMWIGSWIKNRRVIILIDNGSTHNFINQEIARKLNLKATLIEPIHVRVANGDRLTCAYICKAVPIKVQGVSITADMYVIPLGGTNIILGN